MRKRPLNRPYKAAVRHAMASIPELARAAGYSPATLKMYLYTERPVSVDAALAMAAALDQRAAKLAEHARRLREVAREHPTHRPVAAKKPRRR